MTAAQVLNRLATERDTPGVTVTKYGYWRHKRGTTPKWWGVGVYEIAGCHYEVRAGPYKSAGTVKAVLARWVARKTSAILARMVAR